MNGRTHKNRLLSGIYLLFVILAFTYHQSSFAQLQNIPQNSSTVVIKPDNSKTVIVEPKANTNTDQTKKSTTIIVQPNVQEKTTKEPSSAVVVVPVIQENLGDQQRKVEEFVRKAADYAKENGREAALIEFNKKNGQFSKGTTYIFAMDYQGNLLADAYSPELIGKNQFDLQDLNGKYINHDLISKAKAGGGWELYHWPNPVTHAMECKKTFTLPMEGYFIASGYFYLPNAEGKCE